MPEKYANKLPVLKILISSLVVAWFDKAKFSKALALPTLILVLIWTMTNAFTVQFGSISYWLIQLLSLLGLSVFAVTSHRLILVPANEVSFFFPFNVRIIKFAILMMLIFVMMYLVLTLFLTLSMNLVPKTFLKSVVQYEGYYAVLLSMIPAMYVVGRLSLVFPATAIDHTIRLRDSWSLTRKNGWRMAIIVGFYPWLLKILVWLLLRDNASVIEWVIVKLLHYYVYAVVVFALSLAYVEFMKWHLGSAGDG